MNILQQLAVYISSVLLAVLPTTKYTEGVVGQPESFFPHQASKQNDVTVSRLIYRGLFKYDIYGKLIPELAESWAVSDNNTVYTIKLKDNQYWSDGTKINSDDLIYTAFKVSDLQGVATDKVDELTVRYILPNEFSPFLSMLTVGVMQSNSEDNYGPLNPVTSGPFKILNVIKSGPIVKEMVLLNENGDSEINKIVFRYYGDENELVTAAKLGEIQGFMANDIYEIENFENFRFPLQGVYFALFFNLDNKKLSDVATRQKLEKVLDIEEVIFDKGIFVQGPISRSPFTDLDNEFDKYDEDYKEDIGTFTLTITIPDIKQHREAAKVVRDMWEDRLGINVEINKVNPENIVSKVIEGRNYEVLLYGQAIGRDPDRYINWHSTQKDHPGLNLSRFEQVRADRALEEGRREIDNDKRLVHYNEFQKVIVDEVPAIFLYHPYRNYYVSKFIEGIGEKYTFGVSDRFLDFSNWSKVRTN